MRPDRCLAGAGTTLDGEDNLERGPDDLVLLGLDGGHDVEHLARPGPLELGQQGVAATETGARGIAVVSTEQVVGDGNHLGPVHHHLTSTGETERVLGAGLVEGRRNGGAPVAHDRITLRVLDVAASDVPRRTGLLINTSEEKGTP